MSRRNSLSERIGKYFGYFASSSPNLLNQEQQKEIESKQHSSNNPSMAQPSSNPQPSLPKHHHAIRNKHNDTFATKNFDKIDYIVQIPLIDNPKERQTRFLLAMDYTLPPRNGLGIMDTALEHIVHYFDMNKAELIFCEMWQSVCLFIEFHDTDKCQEAYNQLFQFFKTIFYVEDLNQLEELWICSHCKHYNQFDEYLRGLNTINDKRKDSKGDEYIYWCNRCKNVNHPTYKKIKYSYQRATKHNNNAYIKSNRDQIGSISNLNNDYYRNQHRHRADTDPEHKEEAKYDKKHASHAQPKWTNANSQPIACTSSIYAQMQQRDAYNRHHVTAGENNDAEAAADTVGCDILMGQAHGKLKFNVPKKKLNVLIASKSMDSMQKLKQEENNKQYHHRHNSAISGVSSSPEIVSPASSASLPPQKDLAFGLNIHGKKYSVDSAISVTSTTSTVSSIDNNLDLCCTILETIEQKAEELQGNNPLIYDHRVTQNNLQELELQKKEVMRKISKLRKIMNNIENRFTVAMDQHKYSMTHALDDCKEQEAMHANVVINHSNVYKGGNVLNNSNNNNNNNITPSGNALTSQNLQRYISFQQAQQILSDEYTHAAPQQDDDEDINSSDDDLRTPAGATSNILMGQAQGFVHFKLPPTHHK